MGLFENRHGGDADFPRSRNLRVAVMAALATLFHPVPVLGTARACPFQQDLASSTRE
jgi:hypothetical protein